MKTIKVLKILVGDSKMVVIQCQDNFRASLPVVVLFFLPSVEGLKEVMKLPFKAAIMAYAHATDPLLECIRHHQMASKTLIWKLPNMEAGNTRLPRTKSNLHIVTME